MGISRRSVIREIVITVLLALLFFLVIRTFIHNFEVRGFSMEPSLHDGQHLIVSKAAYWFSSPNRGDIVVFNSDRVDHGIIHRIGGLPGELIEIKRGEIYVNGEKLEEPYIQGNSLSAPPQRVPDDSYFIVGDNRNAASWDIVRRGDIVGKAWVSYWPLSEWGFAPNHSWHTDSEDDEVSDAEELSPSY